MLTESLGTPPTGPRDIFLSGNITSVRELGIAIFSLCILALLLQRYKK